MRDVELLRQTMSSGKRLRLGGGRVADGGACGFAGFGGLGVRMGAEGWEGGTMAKGRACPKYGVSYESTPTRLDNGTSRRDFRLRDRRGISRVRATRPISEEGGVFVRVDISG
jgi:hypothetical protein